MIKSSILLIYGLLEGISVGGPRIDQNIYATISTIKTETEIIADKIEKIGLKIHWYTNTNTGRVSGITLGSTIDELNNKDIVKSNGIQFSTATGETTGVITTNSKIIVEIYEYGAGTDLAKVTREYTTVIFGDINADGQINSDDLTEMYNLITTKTAQTQGRTKKATVLACDINGDGDLTAEDYTQLQNHINNGTVNEINQNREALLLDKDWSTWVPIEL